MAGIAATIRACMALRGVDRRALAEVLGLTPEAVSLQLSRDAFNAAGLVHVADKLGYRVCLVDKATGDISFTFSPDELPLPRRSGRRKSSEQQKKA